jgi:hypothetical protein
VLFDVLPTTLSQKYCDLVKIVLDNSQNFGIIPHILRHNDPSGLAFGDFIDG